LAKERFMARLIRIESRKPEAPSSAPAMISTLLSIAKPVAEAARGLQKGRPHADRWPYFETRVILEPWMPIPAIRPFWSKMKA
jgi:hypothetical protein